MMIRETCNTLTGILALIAIEPETIRQDGETFSFAPVSPNDDQVDALRALGYYQLTHLATGREGLGWTH